MRPVWWGLLFAVVCLPLAFVVFLIPAAKYPAMDAFTLKLPMGIRSVVAELTMHRVSSDKDSNEEINRAINLDPENPDGWSWRCWNYVNEKNHENLAACQKAVALNPIPTNFNSLGLAQEQAKDYCTAENSFTSAIQRSSNNPTFLRNMARAALRCGHTGASSAGFEVAESLDAKAAAAAEDDDDAKDDLVTDREYLTVVYDRLSESEKAGAVCAKAHPDWKSCHCELNDSGVKCSGGPTDSTPKQ